MNRAAVPCAAALWAAASLFPGAAAAVELRIESLEDAAVALTGEYRLQGTFLSDFPVDAGGTSFGQSAVLDQRLRAGGEFRAGPMRLGAEFDFLSGQLAGDTWDVPVTLDERRRDTLGATSAQAFTPRRAALTLSWPGIALEAGLVTSHWGLGMVANDGARDPWFGRNDFGDRVVRLRVTGRPLRARAGSSNPDALSVTLAGDWVVGDDLARADRGQVAFQAVASVAWTRPGLDAVGVYGVLRRQEEPDGGATRLAVVDLYLDRTFAIGERLSLRGAVEGAFASGTTTRVHTYNAPDSLDVRSGGFAGLLHGRAEGLPVSLVVHGGWASGDTDPDDGVSADFTFDRDFDAGAALYDTVLAGIEAGTYALLTDPQYSGQPPAGVDGILTEGAFRRAAFLQPIVEVEPFPWLTARIGVMAVQATADVVQPFYTTRAGGDPRNHLDQAPGGRYLGTEIGWSVRVGGALPKARPGAPRIELLAQGAHVALGGALRGPDAPGWVHQASVTGRVRW